MWFPKSERGRATSLFASAFLLRCWHLLAALRVVGLAVRLAVALLCARRDRRGGRVRLGVLHARAAQPPGCIGAELDYIIQGGALVDIDSAHERNAKGLHLSGAVVKSLLANRMLWCAYIGQYSASSP